jgi:hypothetical protein
MIKKILNITVWLVIIAFMVITLSFASSRQKEIKCGSVMISINDNTGNQFIDPKEVLELIKNKGKKLSGINFDKINISEIEKIILNHPSVKKANVFMTIDGTLHIEVRQRKPIIRIVKNNSESLCRKNTLHVCFWQTVISMSLFSSIILLIYLKRWPKSRVMV